MTKYRLYRRSNVLVRDHKSVSLAFRLLVAILIKWPLTTIYQPYRLSIIRLEMYLGWNLEQNNPLNDLREI